MVRNIDEDIEDGIVAYGRIKAIGGSIAGCIFVIVLCAIGLFMLKSSQKSYTYAQGRITSVNCNLSDKCNIVFEYYVGDKKYEKNTYVNRNNFPDVGKNIDVYYNSDNPTEYQLQSSTSQKLWGGGMMVIGCLICISLCVNLYMVMTYDQAAVESAYSTTTTRRSHDMSVNIY